MDTVLEPQLGTGKDLKAVVLRFCLCLCLDLQTRRCIGSFVVPRGVDGDVKTLNIDLMHWI